LRFLQRVQQEMAVWEQESWDNYNMLKIKFIAFFEFAMMYGVGW
jgi:hypothetical protein